MENVKIMDNLIFHILDQIEMDDIIVFTVRLQ